jgi:microsomal dipeptidase-like Zn-dependent dipeptidase
MWFFLCGLILFIVFLILLLRLWPGIIERFANKVITKPPYPVDDDVKLIHEGLFIADLHADTMLWARDLLKESRYGHVDLPRLIPGNVGLQVMGVVTKFTLGFDPDHHSDSGLDLITLLAWFQGWPRQTWGSLLERALYQAKKLEAFVDQSQGKLRLIKGKADLEDFLVDRGNDPTLRAAMLLLEGVHALEKDIDNLDALYDAGYRFVGLTHFFDNKAGGSSSGKEQFGLTPWGKDLMKAAQDRGMLIDLAHASEKLIEDVLDNTTAPVIVSHGGIGGVCDFIRNLKDEHIQGVADTGGIVGAIFYDAMIDGSTMEHVAHGIEYIVNNFGVDYAALGSDFDGFVKTPTDVTGLPLLTNALLNKGMNEGQLNKIYGENFLRVLRAVLP